MIVDTKGKEHKKLFNVNLNSGYRRVLLIICRTASVQAITDVTLWVLERAIYKTITTRIGMERHSEMMAFLQKVNYLRVRSFSLRLFAHGNIYVFHNRFPSDSAMNFFI